MNSSVIPQFSKPVSESPTPSLKHHLPSAFESTTMPSKRANRRRAVKNRATKDQDSKSDQAVGHQATESHVTETYAPNQGLIGRLPVDLQLKIYHSLDYPSAIFLAATSRFYRSVVYPSTLIPRNEKIRFIQLAENFPQHTSVVVMSLEKWESITHGKRDENHIAAVSNAERLGKYMRTMLGWRVCQHIGRRWRVRSTSGRPFGNAPFAESWAAGLQIMDVLDVAFVFAFMRAAYQKPVYPSVLNAGKGELFAQNCQNTTHASISNNTTSLFQCSLFSVAARRDGKAGSEHSVGAAE
ncbi:hypothetical protein IWZ00DRAFT_569508 [Phyllosticta capitalensis]